MAATSASPRAARTLRFAGGFACLVLLGFVGAWIAYAGEKPRPGCGVAVAESDESSEWCTLISRLEVYGGQECKPEVMATAAAARYGVVPEGCCGTGISFDQQFAVRLAFDGSPSLLSSLAADSIPCVAYVRYELDRANGRVSIRFPGWSADVYPGAGTPSFRDTLRGKVAVSALSRSTPSTLSVAGQIFLMGNVHAEVCNGSSLYDESIAIADPYLEVDPASPYHGQWRVEKETTSGSGVWVEMRRDSADVTFTAAASGVAAEPSPTSALAWGDMDADGDLDLFVASSNNTSCRLFRNDGGALVDVTTADLALPFTHNMDVDWADIDNDGDLDLFLVRGLPPARHALLRNTGAGVLVRDSSSALCVAAYGRGASWADYDRDGDLDVFIAHCGEGNKLFRNDGTGLFTDATTPLLADYGCCMGGIWGDYDGDGDPDLYLMTYSGSTRGKLLRNDAGAFVDVTGASALPVNDLATTYSGTWVDYDDDGRLDLCVLTDSGNRLFHNLGTGAFADSTNGWLAHGGKGAVASWGDLDLDGDLDCYLSNRTLANRVVVRFGGHFGNSIFHVGGPVDLAGVAVSHGWADVDGDGDLDLGAAYADARRLLRNDQALGHHWLAVDLHGIQDNRFGLGARVRLVAGGRSQHRSVLCDGFRGGNPLRQTFGLDSLATVDTLEVRWPNGAVTTLAGPFAADRRVTLWQDGTVSGIEPGDSYSGAPRLLGPGPNPFQVATTIRFQLPRPMRVELSLYDVAGRRLRTLTSDGEAPAGVGALSWDGRTDAGALAQPGVYFCRMRAGGAEAGRNLVIRVVRVK